MGTELKDAQAETPARKGMLSLPRLRHTTRADWTQLVQFCIVGASGYVVNLVVFSIAFHLLGMHHITAAILAFWVAWTNNFLLNRQWTFSGAEGSAWAHAARYLMVSLFSLGLNLVILESLLRGFSIAETLAQAIAIVAVTPVGFLLNRRWAFR